ncbi:MAG TPA: DUF1659 domain-containing protein [Clostridia bacterium]|nr:DUF1659 domain-containing protein [Clostridia bacterium]
MALEVTPLSSRLSLRVQTGTDDEGNPVMRTRSYSGIKPSAADQDVYDVAQVIAGLQQHPVEEITRVNEDALADTGA